MTWHQPRPLRPRLQPRGSAERPSRSGSGASAAAHDSLRPLGRRGGRGPGPHPGLRPPPGRLVRDLRPAQDGAHINLLCHSANRSLRRATNSSTDSAGRPVIFSTVWVPETVSPMPPGQICGLSRQVPALPAPVTGDLRGCATAGTPRVQQPRCRVGSFLPSASRYISGTTSRDHESCPAFWPPSGATAVHFQLGGLDLYGLVLAPCLFGCAGTDRQGPALTSLCLAGLRYSSARHSIPVIQVF
jgi:hypothetical protein